MSGETQKSPSGWTVDTILAYMSQRQEDLADVANARIDALIKMMDERSAQQYIAVQTAFNASDAALNNQQEAVETAFSAADSALQAALGATEKAIDKAEMASERRFESVNEFRGQLADQAARLMPRSEAEARLSAQQTAMMTAFDAADAALRVALDSGEKASLKAELATNRRFEAADAIHKQLIQQAATFMPREEIEARISAVGEKVDVYVVRSDARAVDFGRRLDIEAGRDVGSGEHSSRTFALIAATVGVLGVLLALGSFVYALVKP